MNWLHYLVEANLYLAVFYTVYYLFLSNDTHYTLNRVYLLLSCVVSFIIPVVQLGFLKHAPQAAVIQYVNYRGVMVKPIEVTLIPPPEQFTWQDGVFYIYLTGAGVLLLVLLFKLYQLIRLTRKHNEQPGNNYKLVYLNDSNTAFSFFNFLFIGTKAVGRETIIKHELVHISQKHSADIVFIELLKIVNWFNPFIYVLQHSLKAIHEYIADERTAAAETDAFTYSSFLVHNAYGLSGSSITHSFFNYNLLKKRIIMLNQKRSGNLARLKYLLAVPICAGLLCASTLAFSKNYGWVDIAPKKSPKLLLTNAVSNPSDNINRFKLTQEDKTCISDKITVLVNKNLIKTYTVNSITAADKAYLLKYYALKVEVVNVNKNIPHPDINQVVLVPGSSHIAPPPPAGPLTNVYINDNVDTIKSVNVKGQQTPPPPPPAHPKVTDVRLLPPPPRPNDKNVRFAAPASPSEITKKGYKYAEAGYLVNGKTDFKVTIVEKDGTQTSYYKSSSSAKQLKMLRDKYGYSFPNMSIYSKLPPPPPTPPAQEAPQTSIDKRPPPPPPTAPVSGELKRSVDTLHQVHPLVNGKNTSGINYTRSGSSISSNKTPTFDSLYTLKGGLEKKQKMLVGRVIYPK